MRFCLLTTISWTVKQASHAESGWKFDVSKGVWWPRLSYIESLIDDAVSGTSFGESIDTYAFGFEISDTSEGFTFEATRNYVSYRPKTKSLLSVGQVDWPVVRLLRPVEQLDMFKCSLFDSISRAADAKRKSRDFKYNDFYSAITRVLENLDHRDCAALLSKQA